MDARTKQGLIGALVVPIGAIIATAFFIITIGEILLALFDSTITDRARGSRRRGRPDGANSAQPHAGRHDA